VIVFQDAPSEFTVSTIRSQMTHVFFIIFPETAPSGEKLWALQILTREGVPLFGPKTETSSFRRDEVFKAFLFQKLLNAQLAALQAPEMSARLTKNRELWLKDHIETLERLSVPPEEEAANALQIVAEDE